MQTRLIPPVWHQHSLEAVLTALNATHHDLSQDEAESRLQFRAMVIVNKINGIAQESRAEQATDAIGQMRATRASVRNNVLLEARNKVPAAVRIGPWRVALVDGEEFQGETRR